MAGFYIYKHTGAKVIVCAPIKGRIEFRGVQFKPGDLPVITNDGHLYAIDDNELKANYRVDPNPSESVPMICTMFDWNEGD